MLAVGPQEVFSLPHGSCHVQEPTVTEQSSNSVLFDSKEHIGHINTEHRDFHTLQKT